MRKRVLYGFVMVAVAILAGCSSYNKLIKSGDYDKIYKSAIDYYEGGKFQKALDLFEQVAPYYSGTVTEDTVSYYVASTYYKMGDFDSSSAALDEFRRRFGRSPFIEDAEYMYAMGFYFSSPDANRDQTMTKQAIQAIQVYMERYPNSIKLELCKNRIEELQNKLYEKALINAKTYYKIGRYKSAIVALDNALTEYSESPYREELLYLLLSSHNHYASNSIASQQTDRYLNMMDAYYNFVAEFPDSKYRKEADKMQKEARKYIDNKNSNSEDKANTENGD